MLYDENLLPKQNYSYRAYYTIGGVVQDSSAPMIITTMDTTSHEFTWEIDTIGNGSGTIIRDVSIVNDTCVFVVGEINIKDAEGNWILCNFARWNGYKWTLIRVMYNYQGSEYYAQLHSVFAYGINDYWVGSNQPMHWDGNSWKTFDLPSTIWNGWIHRIWGDTYKKVYLVGSAGAIAKYDGTQWQIIESGTDVNLTDIWGSPDGSVVWACGYNATSRKMQLLRYFVNQSWEIAYNGWNALGMIREDSLSGRYFGLYTPCRLRIFIGSSAGLYESFYKTKGEAKRYSYTPRLFPEYPYGMRGNDINDIFIVGNNNYIVHYNGNSWRDFTEIRHTGGILYSVAVKDNLVVAVGYLYHPWDSKGIVFIGRR